MKKIYILFFLFTISIGLSQTFVETNHSSNSNDGTGIYVNTNGYRSANDLTVYPNFDLNLKNISFNVVVQNGGQVNSIDLTIYDDNNAMPGNIVYNQNSIVPTSTIIVSGNGFDLLKVDINLDVILPGQIDQSTRYWISPVATVSNTQLVWWELTYASTNGLRIYEHTMGNWVLKAYGDGVILFRETYCLQTVAFVILYLAGTENFAFSDFPGHCWNWDTWRFKTPGGWVHKPGGTQRVQFSGETLLFPGIGSGYIKTPLKWGDKVATTTRWGG